ncbi:MAG: helix-turn-helix domain-containing protein [Aminipila sp.]
MDNTVFDSREVAEYLHICYDTLVRKVKKQEIPHFKIGRKLLFRKTSLDEFIRKQEAGENEHIS